MWSDAVISHTIFAHLGKSFKSVQCAITGPCLRMRHSPHYSALYRFGRFARICSIMKCSENRCVRVFVFVQKRCQLGDRAISHRRSETVVSKLLWVGIEYKLITRLDREFRDSSVIAMFSCVTWKDFSYTTLQNEQQLISVEGEILLVT